MDDRVLTFVALALLLPAIVAAQAPPAGDNGSVEDLPIGQPVGPRESVEDRSGAAYGGALIVGMIAFLGVLGAASWAYSRRRAR